MKFSELAETYDLIQQAKREPERVRILADLFRRAETNELEAIAHFTASEMVKPALSLTSSAQGRAQSVLLSLSSPVATKARLTKRSGIRAT